MTSGNAAKKATPKKGNKKATSKSPAKRPTRYDWDTISRSFIEGIPVPDGGQYERSFHTQKEIAELFDVPYQRVREHASKERWTEQRHSQQVELAMKRQKERNEKILGEAIDFDESTLKIAKVGINLITARLSEIAADVRIRKEIRDRARARMEAGEKVDRWELYSAVDYREMDALANAAGKLQEIGNKALGIDVQKHEISGPGGGPLQVDGVSVGDELLRDDPERLTALLAAAVRAGLDVGTAIQSSSEGEDDIHDAEWTEDSGQESESDN